MPVPMGMRLRDRPIMLVVVMLIMGMAVFMFECIVGKDAPRIKHDVHQHHMVLAD